MLETNHCPICKSHHIELKNAKFSDFIIERVFDNKIQKTNIAHCLNCGFQYSTYRYTEAEINKLYHNYRDEFYQKQRMKYDTWYSPQINELIGKNPIEIKNRTDNLLNILNSVIPNWKQYFSSVLDYGGDRGQFIPQDIPQKYVYEISGIKPLKGCKSITKFDRQYDFVMCCHVLEHVTNPDKIVEELKSLVASQSFLYIELPFDLEKRTIMNDLSFLFNPYFRFKDLVKQFIKQKQAAMPIISEHINFFTEKSICSLLEKQGFRILHSSINKIDSKWCKSSVISVLAQKQ